MKKIVIAAVTVTVALGATPQAAWPSYGTGRSVSSTTP